MLEQIKHNMETIAGVAVYPVVSLLIFFGFFVGLAIWAFSYRSEKLDELSQLPFEDK